jgi:hypothetical protein
LHYRQCFLNYVVPFKTDAEVNVEYAEKRGGASDERSAAELRNQKKPIFNEMKEVSASNFPESHCTYWQFG